MASKELVAETTLVLLTLMMKLVNTHSVAFEIHCWYNLQCLQFSQTTHLILGHFSKNFVVGIGMSLMTLVGLVEYSGYWKEGFDGF